MMLRLILIALLITLAIIVGFWIVRTVWNAYWQKRELEKLKEQNENLKRLAQETKGRGVFGTVVGLCTIFGFIIALIALLFGVG